MSNNTIQLRLISLLLLLIETINIFINLRNALFTTTTHLVSTTINNNNTGSIWPDLILQYNNVINWENILFVGGRHPFIRYIQFMIACHGLIENLFYLYLSYEVFLLCSN